MKILPPVDLATPVGGYINEIDPTATEDTDRASANEAMETLIAIAKTDIWRSHRGTGVDFVVPLNPVVDLDKTISVSADGVTAKGKCRSVTHRMNPETGRAVSEVEIAICSISGVGIDHPETPTEAPAGSDPGQIHVSGIPVITFNSGATDDHVFSIVFPGVDDPGRQNARIEIPTGTTLTFNGVAMGDCSNGIELEVQAACGAVTSKNFDCTEFQIDQVATAQTYVAPDYESELTRCQRYLPTVESGSTLDPLPYSGVPQVDAAINAMPSPEREAARIEWDYSSSVERNRPITQAMITALGMSEAEADDLFRLAATL